MNVSGSAKLFRLDLGAPALTVPDDLVSTDESRLGGKALGLLRLARLGAPIPPAFVLPIGLWTSVRQPDTLWPHALRDELASQLADPAFAAPQPLAVRSSPPRSLPGALDTLLNVADSLARPSDRTKLVAQAIRAVADSFWSPRAVAARLDRLLPHDTGTAVIVQRQIAPRLAGVAELNAHDAPWVLDLEFTPGLAADLVHGRLATHRTRWRLDPTGASLPEPSDTAPSATSSPEAPAPGARDIAAALQQAMPLNVVQAQVAAYGPRLEFEWALDEAGQFWFLQVRALPAADRPSLARPIAGSAAPLLDPAGAHLDPASELLQSLQPALNREAAAGRRLWVEHDFAAAVPCPTPLTADILRRFASLDGPWAATLRRLGLRPPAPRPTSPSPPAAGLPACDPDADELFPPLGPNDLLGLIAGRLYASAERVAATHGRALPLAYDPARLAADPAALAGPPTQLDVDRLGSRWLCFEAPLLLLDSLRSGLASIGLANRVLQRWTTTARRGFEQFLRTEQQRDVKSLSAADAAALFVARRCALYDEHLPDALAPGWLAASLLERLRERLLRLVGPAATDRYLSSLLRSVTNDAWSMPELALGEVAAGRRSASDFLTKFGRRGPRELELAAPRWAEIPEAVRLAAAQARGREPSPPFPALDRLQALLARHAARSFAEPLESLVLDLTRLLPERERAKHLWMLGHDLLRQAADLLGRRSRLELGVHFLREDELPLAARDPAAWRETIARRQTFRERCRAVRPGVVLAHRSLPPPAASPRPAAAELPATVLVPGVAHGRAVRVDDPVDLPVDLRGAILVTATADPLWAPYLSRVRGWVVARSAALAHSVVVARELGVPVVACPSALDRLHSGQCLDLDARHGRVRIVASTEVAP